MQIEASPRIFYFNRRTKRYAVNTASTFEFAFRVIECEARQPVTLEQVCDTLAYVRNAMGEITWELREGHIGYGEDRSVWIIYDGQPPAELPEE